MNTIKKAFFTTAFALVAFASHAQSFSSPVDYSDYIIGIHKQFNEAMINYTIESVHSDDVTYNEKLRLDIMRLLNKGLADLKKLPPYEGDSKLKNEAIEVFKLYKESFSIDFPQIDQLQENKESSFEAMENYMKASDRAEAKIQKTSKRFQNAHEAYAKKHDIQLIEGEKDNRIDAISNANKYNRAIFLQFFRISKANSEFHDAVSQGKASVMESKRKNLLNESNAALVAIRNVAPLNGDKQFRGAAIEYIEYHRNLAKREFTELIAIIKTDPTERTQEDVNRYNSISQEYNQQNQKLVNAYNNASKELMRTNIPKAKE